MTEPFTLNKLPEGSIRVNIPRIIPATPPERVFDKRWFCRIEFKAVDCWIGAFWKRDIEDESLDVWVCILPMLPIHFGWTAEWRDA